MGNVVRLYLKNKNNKQTNTFCTVSLVYIFQRQYNLVAKIWNLRVKIEYNPGSTTYSWLFSVNYLSSLSCNFLSCKSGLMPSACDYHQKLNKIMSSKYPAQSWHMENIQLALVSKLVSKWPTYKTL